jgi:hypothetical protein
MCEDHARLANPRQGTLSRDVPPSFSPFVTEVTDRWREHRRSCGRAEATRLVWLESWGRRGLHRADGYLSTAAWLTDTYGVAAGAAKREVRTAAALGEMPEVRQAVVAGEGPEAVVLLPCAKEAHPEAFGDHERALVGETACRGTALTPPSVEPGAPWDAR